MTDSSDSPQLMHIGVVADRTGLSLRTLRHYDEVGLVPPSERSEGGFRLYTDADVERILLIRRMKPLGFTLQQMREVLEAAEAAAAPDASSQAIEHLRGVEQSAIERREDLERQLGMADEFLTRLRGLTRG